MQLTDVNQDGLADLLLSFDSRDLRIEGVEAKLEGRTFDGVSFRGSGMVKLVTGPARTDVSAAGSDTLNAPVFSLSAASPQHGTLALSVSLPEMSPARIEVYDITGRRVLEQQVDPGRPHSLEWREGGDLPSGLYLVRVTQGRLTAVRRIVLHR